MKSSYMRGAVCVLSLSSIPLVANGSSIDWTLIGAPGNAADTATGWGSVGYEYRIGKTEVTNAQYAEFLNAVAASDPNALYNTSMDTDVAGGITRSGSDGSYTYTVKSNMDSKPVNYVNRNDNKRFVNWLHNGKPTGSQDASTTEDGAYDFVGSDGSTREADAQVWLPSRDEWYKAAYHDPVSPGADAGGNVDYWLYPTMSDTLPDVAYADGTTGDVIGYWDRDNYPDFIQPPGPNTVIYASEDSTGDHEIGFYWGCTDPVAEECESVGSVGQTNTPSFWGTYDQAGNLREHLEQNNSMGGGYRESQSHFEAGSLDEAAENNKTGFRVAAVVPIPAAVWLFGSGLAGLIAVARKRRTT